MAFENVNEFDFEDRMMTPEYSPEADAEVELSLIHILFLYCGRSAFCIIDCQSPFKVVSR